MTSQEKKIWLNRYRSICRQMESKYEEKARLRSLETKITPTLSDMPKGGDNSSKIEVMSEKIMELDQQISDELGKLVIVRSEIEAAIHDVPNQIYRELLERRYIRGQYWEQIAVDMNYDYRYVLKIHGRALGLLQIVKEDTKRHFM
jgi:hypothetical protein